MSGAYFIRYNIAAVEDVFMLSKGDKERVLEVKRMCYFSRQFETVTVEIHMADGAMVMETWIGMVFLFPAYEAAGFRVLVG